MEWQSSKEKTLAFLNALIEERTAVGTSLIATRAELRALVEAGAAKRVEINRRIRQVREYYAAHWRDDDSPQAESTHGVHRVVHAVVVALLILALCNAASAQVQIALPGEGSQVDPEIGAAVDLMEYATRQFEKVQQGQQSIAFAMEDTASQIGRMKSGLANTYAFLNDNAGRYDRLGSGLDTGIGVTGQLLARGQEIHEKSTPWGWIVGSVVGVVGSIILPPVVGIAMRNNERNKHMAPPLWNQFAQGQPVLQRQPRPVAGRA